MQLERARAGSRTDFDAVYARYFPRCFGAALVHLRDPQRAEQCTRSTLRAIFGSDSLPTECIAAQVWWLLRRRLRGWD